MEEKGQSRARVTAGGRVGEETSWARFVVVHDDWKDWLFAVTVNGAGELVGFEMYGDGAAASTDAMRQARALTGVPVPPEAVPLTARLVRSVPFRELEAAMRRRLAGTDGVRISSPLAQRLKPLAAPKRRPTRAAWTEHDLANLCAEYVALLDEPDPKPMDSLAKRRHLSAKYVRNLIASVRGDLITHGPAGRAGGQLTDKAKEMLSGNHQAQG